MQKERVHLLSKTQIGTKLSDATTCTLPVQGLQFKLT
jgi:hypothetical protein